MDHSTNQTVTGMDFASTTTSTFSSSDPAFWFLPQPEPQPMSSMIDNLSQLSLGSSILDLFPQVPTGLPSTSPTIFSTPTLPTNPTTTEIPPQFDSSSPPSSQGYNYNDLPSSSGFQPVSYEEPGIHEYSSNPSTPATTAAFDLPQILPIEHGNGDEEEEEEEVGSASTKKSRKRRSDEAQGGGSGAVAGLFNDAFASVPLVGASLSGAPAGPSGVRILRVDYEEVAYMTGKKHPLIKVICTRTSAIYAEASSIATTTDGNMEVHFSLNVTSVLQQIGKGQQVVYLQFSLHTPTVNTQPLAVYPGGGQQMVPFVAYTNSKAKAFCWARIIWIGNSPECQELPWETLGQRFAHYYQKHVGLEMKQQSLKYLGKRLGLGLDGQPIPPTQLVSFEQYKRSRVGEWLYNAVEAIKAFPMLWRHYTLQVFLDQEEAKAVLRQYGAQPGDFVFRLPTQLNQNGTGFQTASLNSKLVCTYLTRENGTPLFRKLEISDTTRQEVQFIHEKVDLHRVLCLDPLKPGKLHFKHKRDCMFNERQCNTPIVPNEEGEDDRIYKPY